jgi:signal transduction histidine kinase
MREVVRAGFDRRYVLAPLLAAVALVITAFFVTEVRREYTRDLSELIRDRQDLMREVAELIYACIEAESAQRGYLLTGERQYLDPYDDSLTAAQRLVASVMQRYEDRDREELPALEAVKTKIEAKFAEMDDTLRIFAAGRPREALASVKTDVGLQQMRDIRDELEALRSRERLRIYDELQQWNRDIFVNRVINAASTVFTLILVIAVGLLATREIRRRHATNVELERLVQQRTEELQDLSAYVLRMSELEKSALARELHDELGGLLVAIRMDLAQLKRRIVLSDDDARARWARVDAALASGVELKRRVVEGLRPTLLDNMGLVAAIRWQAEQACDQAKLALELDLPDDEPAVGSDAAIAVFRVIQESLTNTIRHARAKRVSLSLRQQAANTLRVTIEDDGIGLSQEDVRKPGSHGLRQMKFRMHAVGGRTRVEAVVPHGTRTILEVPL